MKKIIALQKMQTFIQGKSRFTLAQVMQELSVSRSTALRYISALEELGTPLYSEKGRNGGYVVAPTYRLPPVRFSSQEIHAMLFAINNLTVLQNSPFKPQYQSIANKLHSILPNSEHKLQQQLQQHLGVIQISQINETKYLPELLAAILDKKHLEIKTKKGHQSCYPIALWYERGRWFLAVFDHEAKDLRVIRCDSIQSWQESTQNLSLPNSLETESIGFQNFKNIRQTQKQSYFCIKVDILGYEHFCTHPFSHLKLEKKDQYLVISGHYSEEEYPYIINYIQGFSQYLLEISPKSLQRAYIQTIEQRLQRFNKR